MESLRYSFTGFGPNNNSWISEYLFCPYCKEMVEKNSKTKSCTCGNIQIDGDSLRIFVHVKEDEIPTFNKGTDDKGLLFNEIKETNYKTIIKPIKTSIIKLSRIDTKRIIVLEDYYKFSGTSNLYILENYKKIKYCEMQNERDYYVSFEYYGQKYLEANTYDCIRSTIDLKSLKITDSIFVK